LKYHNRSADGAPRRLLFTTCAAAFGLALGLPQLSRAVQVTPPSVPAGIEVQAGHKAFLEGHAVGTQNYVCVPSGSGFAWTLFAPEATLFGDGGKQLTTHFFSPDPDPSDKGAIRATWLHSRDSSRVWAKLVPNGSSDDPRFVAPGAIAWLKLERVGTAVGPGGGDTLARTSFVQRLNTAGGSAPADGCAGAADVGKKAFVPYSADYFFYRPR
jgi:hypothetical protein